MALFGSKKKVTSSTNRIRPTVVRTQKVASELAKFAKTYDVKSESLDFNILNVQSYTRRNSAEREGEWEEVANEALRTLDESQLLDPYFEIKQTYEIEIFSKNNQEDSFCDFYAAIGANATKCKIYLSVKESSKIEYFSRFDMEFLDLIRKKKIRAGILIDIFDDMVDDFIFKISAHIKVDNFIEFQKSETFLIAQGYEPTATTHDALVLHYKHKKSHTENEKIDYASRGFIQSVKAGELLIEYIKPKPGKAGRNCRGEYLKPEEPRVTNEPTFSVDESIKIVETPESIEYIAKENGYISFENKTYTIKQEVDVSEVSFKTTGSIRSGKDSDVSMSVKEKDAIKDAVGTGMIVEVSEIDIDGNVGSNAQVIANKANIGGQTHKTAYIEADALSINVHKGRAKGEEVHITRLEHGIVEGDEVFISQAIGGTIKAQEVHIELCASHVKVIASKTIEIQKMQGSENSFVIDPLLQDDITEEVLDNKAKIEQLQEDIVNIEKEVDEYFKKIKEGRGAFLEIKKRLAHYKAKGVKLPASFVKKYKLYQEMQEHLKSLKKELKQKREMLQLFEGKLPTFQHDILEARVINRDRWVGYNEIKFKLIDPPTELIYKPSEGSQDKIFGLVEIDEDEYAILPVKE